MLLRKWLSNGGISKNRIILPVRSLLPGSSPKQTSPTQLQNSSPGALLAPARLGILAAKSKMTWRHFDRPLGCMISPALDELATQLSFIHGLSERKLGCEFVQSGRDHAT